MVPDAHDGQSIVFQFLFNQLKKLTIMLKLAIDAFVADRHGIRQGDGDSDQDGLVIGIIITVQSGDKFLLGLVPQTPKNSIISTDVE